MLNSIPWAFNNWIISFQQFRLGDQLSTIAFNTVDCLVQIIDLPFEWASLAMGEIFGKKISLLKEVYWEGTMMQLRASVDISKTLRRTITTISDDATKISFSLKYEKLPDFYLDFYFWWWSINICSEILFGNF